MIISGYNAIKDDCYARRRITIVATVETPSYTA
jgi:hypothetical protein